MSEHRMPDISHTGQDIAGQTAAPTPTSPLSRDALRSGAKVAVIWVVLVAAAWVGGKYGEQFNLPAPHVIVSVILGLIVASTGLLKRATPRALHTGAQAVTGVVIGTFLDLKALGGAGGSMLPLLAITVATLVLSIVAGLVLARWAGIDQKTASLGMVAGGSAAIVSAADELGADSRQVAFMQYLRLTLVILAMPLIIQFVFDPSVAFHGLGPAEIEVPFSIPGMLFVLWAGPAGYLLGRALRMPAPALLGPVIVAAVATVGGFGGQPPEQFREIAFNIIGLEVGLRLTPAALRAMGRMLPKVLLFVVGITAICAGLAWLATLVTDITPQDAYLATTPGGINAVLAVASSVHSNVALVFTVQALRLLMMVLIVPPVLKWWLNRQMAGQGTAGAPVAETVTAGEIG
ncbi:AbrB family transcriptional regulator [Streptomyces sp. NPDC058067]|uniref:AbrB family transcriptional regulator n=1 Tax=Streptomyces sp. NPDC058067 TaxID=3346324 RepID=UPI0036E607BA